MSRYRRYTARVPLWRRCGRLLVYPFTRRSRRRAPLVERTYLGECDSG
ncbi:MAG: hypothetical protein K2X87_34990 [Gemmataceae bacterium]|nr:hypothetical protein [Gemmataceae bacterium]